MKIYSTSISRKIITATCLLICLNTFKNSQTFPNTPEPWRGVYNITLGDFEFTHPMTVMNSDELQIIKHRIENRIEPQYSAYERLISEAKSQLNFQPDAPVSMDIMGGYEPNSNLGEMRDWLWRNCHAAYTSALAYILSGDTEYADKAKEVLMNWANTGTTFTGADRGLQLGSWFSPMLYAADLINDYDGWNETDRSKFKDWWREKCLNSGDVLGVLRRKDNNWKDAALLGTFAASVVLEDSLLLKEALIQLTSYFYERTDDNVRLPGKGWKIKKGTNFVYLPREVVRNDGRSGLTYTAYALTTMVQAVEIARYAGFNFWDYETQEGASIKDVIEQYFEWDIKRSSFPWNSNPNRTDQRRNLYELAVTHLDINPEIIDWVHTQWPLINGEQGDEYITLTKGDINGTGMLPPKAPTKLYALALSENEIKLNWQDNSDNEDGFLLQRRTDPGNFFTVTNLPPNSIEYYDKFLITDSTLYVYRILSINSYSFSDYSNEVHITSLPKNKSLVILPAIQDTYVMNGIYANDNFGSSENLIVSSIISDDSTAYSFLKYSVYPDTDTLGEVDSVYIQLRAKTPVNSTISIIATTNNWTENSLTWNENLPIFEVISEANLIQEQDYYTWDITEYFMQKIEIDQEISLGFIGDSTNQSFATFYSKESGVSIPELHIARDKSTITSSRYLSDATPKDFVLNQNYPNPFNPTTTISYQVPKTCHVKLEVYNSLGELITVLVDDQKVTGKYQLTWDGGNVASGIYFARLTTPELSSIIKIMLIK